MKVFYKKTEKNEGEELAQQEEEKTISHRFDMEPPQRQLSLQTIS